MAETVYQPACKCAVIYLVYPTDRASGLQNHQIKFLTFYLPKSFAYRLMILKIHIVAVFVVYLSVYDFGAGAGSRQTAQHLGTNCCHLVAFEKFTQGGIVIAFPLYLQFSPTAQALTNIFIISSF